ncbi:gap junction delta-4 protein-like [Antennarius striatus]|uniref:gap junction delta-4 protein-like n=1 Tax=Antennarius striatus TaxID=241820 RepID=UPI0035B0CEDD
MGATDVLFIAISQNVSFMGKTWWLLMLLLRLLVLLLAAFPVFSDEQERFVCNTLQPGCSTVCFDVFSPVSVLRLWLLQLLLLFLPHAVFAAYVLHQVFSYVHFRGVRYGSSSGEFSLRKAPREWDAPRFYCSYFLVVTLRILLEGVFGAGQFFLFGLSVPRSFLCYEPPCTSGVECYVSRPTEKTLMLVFSLGVGSLSVLLSLGDLVGAVRGVLTWRSKKEVLMEEMSKGEQSSVFTTATTMDDGDGRRTSLKPEAPPTMNPPHAPQETTPEGKHKVDAGPAVAARFVLHNHQRPPVAPRGPPLSPRGPLPLGGRKPAGGDSGQSSDGGEDKRAWV